MGREPFVWGEAGQKLTPKQLEERRKIAQALMAKGADFSPAGHWTEALGRAFNGWWGGKQAGQFNKMEEEDTAATRAEYERAFGGSVASPVAAALAGSSGGAYTAPAEAAAIREGLIARGLPAHVADGFIMNFQDESGLNPGINEISPTVPGSRGGFGLYQLTGPRRTAYEAFAAERGVDPSDVDAQLDWLMYELQGPEAKAAQSILSAPDAGSAGAAIVNNFLRPAEEHRNRRAARYMGGASAQVPAGPSSSDLYAMMANPRMVEMYGPSIQAALGSAQARENAVFQQQLQNQDPLRQLQIQQAGLELEQMRNPQVDPWAGIKEVDGKFVRMGQNGPEVIGDFSTTNPQSAIAKLQADLNAGLITQEQYALGAEKLGNQVNVNMGGGPELGKLSADYGYVLDPQTGQPVIDPATGLPTAAPVPGSPAAQEAAKIANAAEGKEDQRRTWNTIVSQDIDKAIDAIDNSSIPVAGFWGNMMSGVAGTPAYNLSQTLNTIKANAGFDRLQAMRDASPTGGALGSVTERELAFLQSTIGSLEQAQDDKQLKENLQRVKKIYQNMLEGKRAYDGLVDADNSGETKKVRKRYNPQTGAFE